MAEVLELTTRSENGVGILGIKGYINNTGGEQIADACSELIESGVHKFLLDLEECNMVNSIGISILIELIETLKELDGRMVFCCVTPTIAKTFRIMGLLQTCSIHETREEALQVLQA